MKKIFAFMIICCVSLNAFSQHGDRDIDFSDVAFWVGRGGNEAVLAVNWCQPAKALAWGVRYDGVQTVEGILDSIAAHDPRFSYAGSGGMITAINYTDGDVTYTLSGNYWWYNINGAGAAYGYTQQPVGDGDFIKFGDEGCATVDDSWNYSWATVVEPAVDINAPDTLFCGAVGTPGCQAIHFENPGILGWATACATERGWQDIATQGLKATFGDDSKPIGPAGTDIYAVVSLGDGGAATLTFDIPISNGDGYDLAVFENSFDDYFLELAFVEISSDGENFVRFPAASLTPTNAQTGTFDTTFCTKINNLAGKYRIGWGTPFDLEELSGTEGLDINNVTHVRIVDVVGTINPEFASRDRYGRIINDPYPTNFASGGFDLTGVAVLNGWKPTGVGGHQRTQAYAYPNPCTDILTIDSDNAGRIELCNINRQLLESCSTKNGITRINMRNYPAGVYILKVGGSVQKILKK